MEGRFPSTHFESGQVTHLLSQLMDGGTAERGWDGLTRTLDWREVIHDPPIFFSLPRYNISPSCKQYEMRAPAPAQHWGRWRRRS